MYFSGQGKVFVAISTNGVPGAFRYLGNVPSLEVQLEADVLEHHESQSGGRLLDARIQREKRAKLAVSLEDFTADNLVLAMYGTKSAINSGTVSAEVAPAGLVVGDLWRLQKAKVSSLVVTDSAGGPATLAAGTDYRLESADHGMVEILNLGAYTQPFKAAYSNAAVSNVALLQTALPERWLRFEGLNTADSNKPVLVELYRASLDPLKSLPLINDEFLKMDLEGAALYDSTKVADAVLGTFGRIVFI